MGQIWDRYKRSRDGTYRGLGTPDKQLLVYKWPAMIQIRQISLRSPSLKMNSKISLILFGLLVALAVLAAENSLREENSRFTLLYPIPI